jgi:iron complex outermembrane receptor protein
MKALLYRRFNSFTVAGTLLLNLCFTMSFCLESEARTGEYGDDLTELSLEQLMNIEVTSVSRRPQKLADAAAAVFVITREDIRRSGVTSIADALRMAPGIEVARIDANKWAVSSRGFNDRIANKMLVLFDGRTVYTPLFSGVFWDRQDTLLEDIDRIEVIRGPGATLWGANAVNGVINIITRPADETVGGLVTAGGGTMERGFGEARYGMKLGRNTSFRLFGKYLDRSNFVYSSGREAADGWHAVRGGFRMDSEPTKRDSLTVQGDIYDSRLGETFMVPQISPPYSSSFDSTTRVFGGNILSRWKHSFSELEDFTLQLYYDRSEQSFALVGEKRDIFDLDFQSRFHIGGRHEVVWGAGYRFSHDSIANTDFLTIVPASKDDHLFSAFVQDDITIIAGRLHLVLGSKFEHNDYTGFEMQPNVRLLWTPDNRLTLWGAISRAVRTPSRSDDGVRFDIQTIPPGAADNPGPVPVTVQVRGSADLKSEELVAYEFGCRIEPTDSISLDLATFYNVYSDLISATPGASSLAISPTPHAVSILDLTNRLDAYSYGAELAASVRVADWWRLNGAYTFLRIFLQGGQQATVSDTTADPEHQFSLRSSMDLGHNLELDLWLRYVDEIPSIGISSYVTLDTRLAWKPLKNLELSLVGQNLLHDRQAEFVSQVIPTKPSDVERGFYGKVTWKF